MKIKHLILFVLVLFFGCFVTGIIYGTNNEINIDYTSIFNNNMNVFKRDIIIFIILLLSSLSLVGLLVNILFIGIESVSLGFISYIIFNEINYKSLLFIILYFIFNKLYYFIVLIYLLYVNYNFIIRIIKNINGSKKDYITSILKPLLKKYILIFIYFLIFDLLIYLFSNKILINFI